MKLLVLAQTPPPVHGQSLMVRTLVEGLAAAAPDIATHHVNLALSRDADDIGRARPGKVLALLGACWRALWARMWLGPMTLYYVPAPGKRAAVWRDWLVMFFLRPFFPRLVLHWHATGLGAWLATKAAAPERWLTRLFLGRAALAIVLAPELEADAKALAPQRVRVVPNGVDVRVPAGYSGETEPRARARGRAAPCHLLFLSQCSREKGLFATLDALAVLNRETPGAFRLTVAGEFPTENERREYHARVRSDDALREAAHYAGAADDALKHALYEAADVFVFPSCYPHEAQPLVIMEALAHDLPIVTSRWRAIPGMLPPGLAQAQLVTPDAGPERFAKAIRAARDAGPAKGALRAHYESKYTVAAHLNALAAALRELP